MRANGWALITLSVISPGINASPSHNLYIGLTASHQEVEVNRDYIIEGEQERFGGLKLDGLAVQAVLGVHKPIWDKWNAAVEGHINHSSADTDFSSSLDGGFNETIERDGLGYGVSALLMRELGELFQGYGRIGYQWDSFESENIDVNPAFTETNDDQFGGVVVGIGGSALITEKTEVRLEYSHVRYSGSEAWSFYDGRSSFEPETLDQISAGVILHF